jgi:hypothetical protein
MVGQEYLLLEIKDGDLEVVVLLLVLLVHLEQIVVQVIFSLKLPLQVLLEQMELQLLLW